METTNFILNTKKAIRFYSKVDSTEKADECHLWSAAKTSQGYGTFNLGGSTTYAHRIAYANQHGNFDKQLCVLHHCDNPPCINPDHLFLGTQADNNRDMRAKGRAVYNQGELSSSAKLTNAQALEVRELYAQGSLTQAEIGGRYKIKQPAISAIITKASFKHI